MCMFPAVYASATGYEDSVFTCGRTRRVYQHDRFLGNRKYRVAS